jgi:hypothetical protein
MPVNVSSGINASALGQTFNKDLSVAADDAIVAMPDIPRAKNGTLTVRGSNTAGTITLEASHGVTTGATNGIDVYWSGGKRYGCVVGTVSGNDVPISGGSGDNLPVLSTPIKAMVPQKENFTVVGDDAVSILAKADARAVIKLQTATPTVILTIQLESNTDGYVWTSSNGVANPLAGQTITSVLMSHEDGVSDRVVRCIVPKN